MYPTVQEGIETNNSLLLRSRWLLIVFRGVSLMFMTSTPDSGKIDVSWQERSGYIVLSLPLVNPRDGAGVFS
jgi:hypothetical protein